MTDLIKLHIKAPLGVITLNQPAKRNAISAAMWAGLRQALEKAQADPAARMIVITGMGDHFAAGADISEFEEVYATTPSAEAYTMAMLEALAVMEQCPKPVIARIRGACVGGGCSIALACDFRIADRSARFGVTPGKLGLVYSLADTRRLARAVGVSAAKDLLFTARLIDAGEAKQIGLCDRLVDDGKLDDAISAMADQIAGLSQWSLEATKKTFALLADGEADFSRKAMALILEAFDGPDFKEGYKAFLEKRKPDFPS